MPQWMRYSCVRFMKCGPSVYEINPFSLWDEYCSRDLVAIGSNNGLFRYCTKPWPVTIGWPIPIRIPKNMTYDCFTLFAWWRHPNIFRVTGLLWGVTGEFPTQRPVTRNVDVFFDLRLNKRLSKQSWGWWFETSSHPLWRHSNGNLFHNLHSCAVLMLCLVVCELFADVICFKYFWIILFFYFVHVINVCLFDTNIYRNQW